MNNNPVGGDDTATTQEGNSTTITVLTNDSDPDGDVITICGNTNPSNGTVQQSGNSFVYTPNAGFVGIDLFTYTICDGRGGSDVVTVTVTVTGQPSDCEPYTSSLCTQPMKRETICPTFCLSGAYQIQSAHTTFECSISIQDDCIQYIALPSYEGSDVIEIVACEIANSSRCDTAYVNIVVGENCGVAAPNNPPIAEDDNGLSENGNPVTIPVLVNDSDPDNDPITITSFTDPTYGTVVKDGNNFIYTPFAGYIGQDQFTYQICDNHGDCDIATVFIEVRGNTNVNCPDTIMIDCVAPLEAVEIAPQFCISGATITSAHTTYNCSIELLDNGNLQYRALPAFAGSEIVSIIGCNAAGLCDTIFAKIDVSVDCGDGLGIYDGNDEDSQEEGIGKTTTVTDDAVALSLQNISPIPTANFLQIAFTAPGGEVEIEVYSLAGKFISREVFDATKGTNMFRLDASEYAVGLYIINITTGDETINSKFIKK